MDVTLVADLRDLGITKTPKRPAGFGITIREYAAAEGVTIRVATNMLEKGVASGALEKMIMDDGKTGAHPLVYFRASDKNKIVV